MFDIHQEYVPTEGEVPEDHWSKSPEYIAEKAENVKAVMDRSRAAGRLVDPFFDIDEKTGRRLTTHEATMKSFQVEYVMTEDDKRAKEERERKTAPQEVKA